MRRFSSPVRRDNRRRRRAVPQTLGKRMELAAAAAAVPVGTAAASEPLAASAYA